MCTKIGRARREVEAEHAEAAALDTYAAGQFAKTLLGGTDIDVLLKLATLELKIDNRLVVHNALEHILVIVEMTEMPILGTVDLALACFLRLGRD